MKRNKKLTQIQIVLVEHALRQITKIPPLGWTAIPIELQPSFARYMSKDVWTAQPDLATLPDAALMIVRDAITRRGEFADDFRQTPGRPQNRRAGAEG